MVFVPESSSIILSGAVLRIPPLPGTMTRRRIIAITRDPHGRRAELPDGTTVISVRNGRVRGVQVQDASGQGYHRIIMEDYPINPGRDPRTDISEDGQLTKRVSPLYPGPVNLQTDPTLSVEYQDLP